MSPELVLELLRLEGYPPLEPDAAARLAAGAENAIAAVIASLEGSLFDTEPAQFLVELERLAEPADAEHQS